MLKMVEMCRCCCAAVTAVLFEKHSECCCCRDIQQWVTLPPPENWVEQEACSRFSAHEAIAISTTEESRRVQRLRGLAPGIPMMKTAEPSITQNRCSSPRPVLDRPSVRGVLLQRIMNPVLMVISHVFT